MRQTRTPTSTTPSTALSGRIMTWSGNLLATCVIVILGLTFGKQVLQWWRGDRPASSVSNITVHARFDGLADPNLPHLLNFGDLPLTFERTVFEGDERAALARLREMCRKILVDCDAPATKPIPVTDDLLRRLEKRTPVEAGEHWRIVQSGGPVITVVALRMMPNSSSEPAAGASQHAASVVSWGLGLRAAESTGEDEASVMRWTLFTCSGERQTRDFPGQLFQPIPPGAKRSVAMRGPGGGTLLGFTGPGTVSSSKQFFDRSFARRGWTQSTRWKQIGTSWYARFEDPTIAGCDVQLSSTTDGGMSGMITMTPALRDSPQNAEK